jgi:hypothetical protein
MRITRLALVAAALAAVACQPGWRRPGGLSWAPTAARTLEQADRDALAGRTGQAIERYEQVVRDHPKSPQAAEALHRLGMLRAEPGSTARDRRAAQVYFRRLAVDYRGTLEAREARAWRNLLRELDRCELEATKRGADAQKLRETLDSIRDSDLELEQ